MRILYFDTETNGLPHVRRAPVHVLENWPRVVQLAWKVADYTNLPSEETPTPTFESREYILRPSADTVWNEESAKIHGISREIAEVEGVDPVVVIREFAEALHKCDMVVAHNLAFDKPIVLAEALRAKIDLKWPSREYCTMANTTNLLKLPFKVPKPGEYKYPKLEELYTYLFRGEVSQCRFHNAANDVECLIQCFHELMRLGVITLSGHSVQQGGV